MNIIKKIKKYFYDLDYELPNLVVITGQKCTLRCKNCANFSPYHSNELDFYDISKIISDLKNITKRLKYIQHMQVQGGDIFLHKDVIRLLNYIKNEEKIRECVVATNSIIIPKKEILEILSDKKFVVRFSSYGVANELNEKKLEKICNEFNINHYVYLFANGNSSWADCGGIDMKKHPLSLTKENYKKCLFKVCLTLENGILSRCSRSTVAHKVQHFRIKKQDFVNVRSPFFNIHKLKQFVVENENSEKGMVQACFYCNGTGGKMIVAGEQISKEESELLINKNNLIQSFKK